MSKQKLKILFLAVTNNQGDYRCGSLDNVVNNRGPLEQENSKELKGKKLGP